MLTTHLQTMIKANVSVDSHRLIRADMGVEGGGDEAAMLDDDDDAGGCDELDFAGSIGMGSSVGG